MSIGLCLCADGYPSDGAYSGTRDAMMRLLKVGNSFERSYISHGYKELNVPPCPKTGGFAMSCPEALHIWPRGKFMMIGLPNADKSFTMTLFAPFHDEVDEVRRQLRHHFWTLPHGVLNCHPTRAV